MRKNRIRLWPLVAAAVLLFAPLGGCVSGHTQDAPALPQPSDSPTVPETAQPQPALRMLGTVSDTAAVSLRWEDDETVVYCYDLQTLTYRAYPADGAQGSCGMFRAPIFLLDDGRVLILSADCEWLPSGYPEKGYSYRAEGARHTATLLRPDTGERTELPLPRDLAVCVASPAAVCGSLVYFTAVQLDNDETPRCIASLDLETGQVRTVGAFPEERGMLYGTLDGEFLLFSGETGWFTMSLQTGRMRPVEVLTDELFSSAYGVAVSFLEDGALFAVRPPEQLQPIRPDGEDGGQLIPNGLCRVDLRTGEVTACTERITDHAEWEPGWDVYESFGVNSRLFVDGDTAYYPAMLDWVRQDGLTRPGERREGGLYAADLATGQVQKLVDLTDEDGDGKTTHWPCVYVYRVLAGNRLLCGAGFWVERVSPDSLAVLDLAALQVGEGEAAVQTFFPVT